MLADSVRRYGHVLASIPGPSPAPRRIANPIRPLIVVNGHPLTSSCRVASDTPPLRPIWSQHDPAFSIQGPSNHAAAPSTLTCPKGLSAICKHAAALGLRRGGPPSPPFGGLCIQRELSRPRGLSGPRLLKAHDLNGRDPQPISAAELVTHLRTICSHQKPLHESQDIAAMTDSTWRNPFAHGPPTGGGVNSMSCL